MEGDERIGHQTVIPHVLGAGSWLAPEWEASFIEPGLKTRYSFVTHVPAHAAFVLLHGRLVYGDGATLHTAESLVTVPPA